VRAMVSKLARRRSLDVADGAGEEAAYGPGPAPLPDSIWKGKEPRPVDAVDNWEAVDKPKYCLFGGSRGIGLVGWGDGRGVVGSGDWRLKVCLASGETGGERIGRSDIGEGGTNGKDSKMESARVEVAETTDDPDTLRVRSRPWAWARACA